MMKFIADFHIHSKYSRATSKRLDLENLYIAAQLKGISVIGTGDFTHPGWFAEIESKLEPAEQGLYKLKAAIAEPLQRRLPTSCRSTVRFLLTAEISNIYKQGGKTRKNHNLIFLPDRDAVRSLNSALEKIGNIVSDGRPILGISAKHLLEILLDVNPEGFLIPAHIWTPWFSLLGSKSGFDSLEECFEELSSEIWAVETGLSSDPPMNWRVSELDRVTLISNSDAHSTQKLGREANVFNTELSFPAIKAALKNKESDGFEGTIEFYPEEGKYHLDGHRKCGVRTWPEETRTCKGRCRACGQPLTRGVLYRVEEIADRAPGFIPANARPFYSLIPLHEVLSEILNVGSNSQRVQRNYQMLLENFGPEFNILLHLEADQLDPCGVPLLSEAVHRMRTGNIACVPGYDGEFGRIRVFGNSERQRLLGQKSLFRSDGCEPNRSQAQRRNRAAAAVTPPTGPRPPISPTKTDAGEVLNSEQRRAVETEGGAVLVVAGPGTGKTRTLTYRIVHLMGSQKVPARHILAITFTRKAAEEMRHRLGKLLPPTASMPHVATFHALGWSMLNTANDRSHFSVIDALDQKRLLAQAVDMFQRQHGPIDENPFRLIQQIIHAKRHGRPVGDLNRFSREDRRTPAVRLYRTYQKLLSIQRLFDYDDLIFQVVRRLEDDAVLRRHYQQKYRYILVDEFQDINAAQFRLLKLLAPQGENLFAIGDPDQSVYGFRGSDVSFFDEFENQFTDARVFNLQRNYRSNQTILSASQQVIDAGQKNRGDRARVYSGIDGFPRICILQTETAASEAVAIGRMIERQVGGLGFFSMDFGNVDSRADTRATGFADIAVLFRTKAQAGILLETFAKAGIPCRFNNREHAAVRGGRSLILSVLRVVEGYGSYLDFERYSKYSGFSISRGSVEKFTEWGIQKGMGLDEALTGIRRFPLGTVKKSQQRILTRLSAHIQTLRNHTRPMTVIARLENVSGWLHPAFRDDYPDFEQELTRLNALAATCGPDIDDLFSAAALQSDTDLYDPQAEAVALMSLHAAKGLEFPVVFIAGCEDGYLPLDARQGEARDVEEERRLFYVGMTRAKDVLVLSHAGRRRIFGKRCHRRPSPFLQDIQDRLKAHEKTGKNLKSAPPRQPKQLGLF